MKNDIIFIPLGGGQRVGASCYYLKIDNFNIILDAGTGMENGMEFSPNLYSLIASPFVQSMGQINHIFISHAHMDHVGYLMQLMSQTKHASVYMTEITKALTEYQLYDRAFVGDRQGNENQRLASKSLLEQIVTVSYLQTIDFGCYKTTFYPAGHIPGAMMTLIEARKRRILYTGDYSIESTALTDGCMLPKELDIDVVIICGLHAKHPGYEKKSDKFFEQAKYALEYVKQTGQSIVCRISQLSKGIEFLKILNKFNSYEVPIYIDSSIINVVEKMERLSVPILDKCNKIMCKDSPQEAHIYLTSNKNNYYNEYCKQINVNFSLHEDFPEMRAFIKKINPKQVVLVHCGKEHSVFDCTIEQEMMRDGECRTQFVFANENEIYKL